MGEFIQEQVELIENKFPELDYDTLYQLTWDVLEKIDSDTYDSMEIHSRVGYLQHCIEVTIGSTNQK